MLYYVSNIYSSFGEAAHCTLSGLKTEVLEVLERGGANECYGGDFVIALHEFITLKGYTQRQLAREWQCSQVRKTSPVHCKCRQT